jgi:hypothetical protein
MSELEGNYDTKRFAVICLKLSRVMRARGMVATADRYRSFGLEMRSRLERKKFMETDVTMVDGKRDLTD